MVLTSTVSLLVLRGIFFLVFFFNDTATTEIYTLSLHDALPISSVAAARWSWPSARPRRNPAENASPQPVVSTTSTGKAGTGCAPLASTMSAPSAPHVRSEEHTSELQSLTNLVCRLLLEKKKNECMEQKRDLKFGSGSSPAYSSLRSAVFDALRHIVGPETHPLFSETCPQPPRHSTHCDA